MLASPAFPLATAPRHGFAWAIGLYQRHLSPLKGFKCAHRVLHRGCSCSQFATRVVLTKGVRRAVMMTLGRFQKCKQAYVTLLNAQAARRDKGSSKWDYLDAAMEGAECLGTVFDAGALDCGALDCGGCAF